MVYIYDGILEAHKANEIRQQEFLETNDEAAKTWFSAVICDGEGRFDEMPAYRTFVDKIDENWDLYYDYGACYYFAVNENVSEED